MLSQLKIAFGCASWRIATLLLTTLIRRVVWPWLGVGRCVLPLKGLPEHLEAIEAFQRFEI